MDQEKELLAQQLEEARQTALDIEEGMRSRYWKHLRGKIEGWLAVEKKHLEICNARLIRTLEDLEDRNDTVKRIALLGQFLSINEIVRDEHLGIISSTVNPEIERYRKQPSFLNK